MKEGTAIEWTHVPGYRGETWNPVTGCDRVTPGCAHCYALELAGRLKGMGQKRYQRDGDPKTSGPGFAVTLHPDKLADPLRWKSPRAVFVNSMSDVFHEVIPDDFVAQMFAVMALAYDHIFMVLTKRPERMHDLLGSPAFQNKVLMEMGRLSGGEATMLWPLPNVWMGVTIENRRYVDRATLLRETPAAVRFISAEPLLGPLLFDGEYMEPGTGATDACWADEAGSHVAGFPGGDPNGVDDTRHIVNDLPELDLSCIDWLIVGGESGPHHRAIKREWVIALREACMVSQDRLMDSEPQAQRGTAFFFKQWGGRTPKAGGRELDGREWSEFPVVRVTA